MRKSYALGIAAASLSVGISTAQTVPPPQQGSVTPPPPAASSQGNPPLALRHSSAATPARGANSFTAGQAAKRIAAQGFTDIANLTKDKHGVWRGHAVRNGMPVDVWLDFRGDVGSTER